MLCKLLTGLCC